MSTTTESYRPSAAAILRTAAPINYPHNSMSGIHDAGAFKIGASETIHKPAHYVSTRAWSIRPRVVAVCGTYGYAPGDESPQRRADWAAGYDEPREAWCVECWGHDHADGSRRIEWGRDGAPR